MNLDYHNLHKSESAGVYGAFGLVIQVAVHPPEDQHIELDLSASPIWNAVYEAERLIKAAIMEQAIGKMPGAQARAKAEREELLGLFAEPIFVQEIPNGYCSDYCCKHLPWFVVTTKVGPITIGWRKRVINIDWRATQGTKTSKELFSGEDVTKDERGIHAWGIEKAKQYVDAIISGVPLRSKT